MKAQYTPDPWFLEPYNTDYFPGVSIGGKKFDQHNQIIVNSCHPDANLSVHWANAQVIAAAPKLLKAAKLMLAFWKDLATSNPGFMGKLCLQDYAQWNQALIALPDAIIEAETGKRPCTDHRAERATPGNSYAWKCPKCGFIFGKEKGA